MSRTARVTVLLASLALLLVAADTVAWWVLTGRMLQAFADWQQLRVAEGVAVMTGPPARAGWPFWAEVILPDVTLATDAIGQPDALGWQTAQLRLVYAPWHPAQVDMQLDGPQTLRFGSARPVMLTTAQVRAHLPLDASGQAQGVVITGRGLSLPLPGGLVGIDALTLRLRPTDVFLSATDATLPGRSLPFGGTIASLDLHIRFPAALPPWRDPASVLAAWRKNGQRVLVDDLALRWGPLDVRGSASLGLDAAMQPEGSGTVKLTGFMEGVEALARSGAITRNDARVAATLLGLVARPGAGEGAEADLPWTLQDRTLSVGAIPLLRIPALAVP